LSPRQLALMDLAAHAEQYLKQEQRKRREQQDRPDHFGDVDASRRNAFQ
jgi:hypothetical protein